MKRKLLEYLKKIDSKEEEFIKNEKNVLAPYVIKKGSSVIDTDKMIREGAMIDIMKQPRFVDIPEHTHKYMEIIYMFSGSATHIIDKTEVKLEADDVLFIKQGTPHSASASGYNDIGIKIFVLPEFLQYPLSMLNEDTALRRFIKKAAENDGKDKEFLHFHLQDLPDAQNLLENMIYSLVTGKGENNRINQTTMGLIFLYLVDSVQYVEMRVPNQYENMISMTTLDYIEQKYKTATLTELCELLHLPMHVLSKMIKKTTGFNFKELLQRKRLNKSVELMCDTDLAISDIIAAVGYENNSYFHRVFKERYHTTPRAFRVANGKEERVRL